jgi:hypothetical protein
MVWMRRRDLYVCFVLYMQITQHIIWCNDLCAIIFSLFPSLKGDICTSHFYFALLVPFTWYILTCYIFWASFFQFHIWFLLCITCSFHLVYINLLYFLGFIFFSSQPGTLWRCKGLLHMDNCFAYCFIWI